MGEIKRKGNSTLKGRSHRVAIIGAGVVGCLVAYGLQECPDVEVICIDKGPPKNELAGTGLNVGPNSLKILRQFSPELADSLQSPGVSLPWESWVAGLTDGTVIFDLPLSQVAENAGIRIRWAELYRQLRQPLGDRIRYNTIALSMGYRDSDRLYLEIENQETGIREAFEDIDLIVGCDGRYSQVRSSFFGGSPTPEHLGVCLYRLLVPQKEGLIEDYQQWFYNGSRLLTFAIPGDEVYVAGSFPLDASLEIRDNQKTVEYLRQCYTPPQGLSPVCQFLVDAVCEHIEEIHWARVQDILIVFGDEGGRVLCLGDASHAMYPTLGQGASQAFEDGCYVGALLRQALQESLVDFPALVARVEQMRRDRITFVRQFSREASDSLLAGSHPAAELQAKTQPAFLAKLRRLYQDTPLLAEALTLG
ncbi:MAG: FAD-dependent monooxygenase [Desertifilum sp. SIO1I2]|nr:FAD-dependent monooxygenase [Desertifilum sp. SIO1I2]